MRGITRRSTIAFALNACLPDMCLRAEAPSRFVKGITSAVFPLGTSFSDCVARASAAGFEATEIRIDPKEFLYTQSTREDAQKLAQIAAAKRMRIASLWALTPGSPSLAGPQKAERDEAHARVEAALRLAPELHCDAVLVTPAVLGRGARMDVTHDQAWSAATEAFRKFVPMAERAGVMLTPENVWSRFLVSPRDMREFVDQFPRKTVGVHFDTGNILQWGYPEDWILTLGSRIRRIHFKDFKLANGGKQGQFVPLLEGDVNWKGVMSSLRIIDYRGFITAEAGPDPSDPEQLLKLSRALDTILTMA